MNNPEVYKPKVSDIIQREISRFTQGYPSIDNETALHIEAETFIENMTYVETYTEMNEIFPDMRLIEYIEERMQENEYHNLVWLFNDAFKDLIWNSIVENYELHDDESNE